MWQPIETAPKDGTWILVDNVKYDHPYVVQWTVVRPPHRGIWTEEDPGDYGTMMGYFDPTHWMPCPRSQHGSSPPQTSP